MPIPMLQGDIKCNILIILTLLNLLGLSQQKTIESMKSYSAHLSPMEFECVPTSTLVGI